LTTLILGSALMAVLIAACNNDATPTAPAGTPAPAGANTEQAGSGDAATAPEGPVLFAGSIVGDGRVVPVRSAELSLPVGGIVDEVLVREGDTVQEGDLLARLDSAQQQVAVAQTQANLQSAQAQLDETKAGARAEEIAAAEAALAAAQARYDRLVNGALPGQIAQAQAAVSASSAALDQVLAGADDQALIAARADMFSAEAALQQAQQAYDLVKWRSDIGALPQSAQLQQATTAYEAAKARLADLEEGASPAQVSGASAQVQQAQAQLETVQNTSPGDVAAAQADVAASQAQLDLLRAGARPEQIAAAEADVAAATAAVQQALVALANTELRAPFPGTVARLDVTPGEQVSPGAPVISLADVSEWQIETEDLTELDAPAVQAGTVVQLAFDALPDFTTAGTVRYVRPQGTDNRGDIVYTAVIDPADEDPRLLWNMTAVVSIEPLASGGGRIDTGETETGN
jgi:multidrug efflux pump subunit AcrA (membrane-fusion protein)